MKSKWIRNDRKQRQRFTVATFHFYFRFSRFLHRHCRSFILFASKIVILRCARVMDSFARRQNDFLNRSSRSYHIFFLLVFFLAIFFLILVSLVFLRVFHCCLDKIQDVKQFSRSEYNDFDAIIMPHLYECLDFGHRSRTNSMHYTFVILFFASSQLSYSPFHFCLTYVLRPPSMNENVSTERRFKSNEGAKRKKKGKNEK